MNKIRLRTKAEIFGTLLMITLLVAVSAASLTRTITDSADNSYTFIRNSNGKFWIPTGANLQAAINDLGSSGGTVWCGSDITLTSEIRLGSYTTIDFESHTVTLNLNITFMNMTGGNVGNTIKNVDISVPNKQFSDIIRLYTGPGGTFTNRIYNNLFEDIHITPAYGSENYNWTGIHLYSNTRGTYAQSMYYNTFRHISIDYCKYGIYMEHGASDTGWMNSNSFDDINIYGYERGVYIGTGVTSTGSNTFNFIKIQTVPRSTYGFYIASGDCNAFTNCFVYDWYAASAGIKPWYISSNALRTYIVTDYLSNADNIYDLGESTYVNSFNNGHLYDRSPYTYIIYKNTTMTFLQDGNSGLIVDKNTNSQVIILEAVNAVTNGIVFIKEGTYDIDTYIGSANMRDITIMGEGAHKTILRAITGLDSGFFNLNGRDNVTFRNICFDGNSQDAIGLYIAFDTSTRGTLVDNCVFRNFNGGTTATGIYSAAVTSDTVTNIKVINSEFYNNDYGIWLRGDADPSIVAYSDISGNYFSASNTNNILLDYARNCTVSNNRIDSGTWGIVLDDSKDCVISNNVISCTNGIDEQGGSNFNIIASNNCRLCTTPIDINGAGTIHANTNLGTIS